MDIYLQPGVHQKAKTCAFTHGRQHHLDVRLLLTRCSYIAAALNRPRPKFCDKFEVLRADVVTELDLESLLRFSSYLDSQT